MKILVAEDEPLTLIKLTGLIQGWGYQPVPIATGSEAWELLLREEDTNLALLDWQMPGLTGEELCRRARKHLAQRPLHIILLTATRTGTDDKVCGLAAGADDFLTKPFETPELRARLKVGERLVRLQLELRRRIMELESALAQVHQLQRLLPICSYCKRIRDDNDYWHEVENYVMSHTGAKFTHGICPECVREKFPEFASEV